MNKKPFHLIIIILILSGIMSVPAFATTKASQKIAIYEITATRVSRGTIGIDFSVDGKDWMNRIGAYSITIYQGRDVVASYDADDNGMSAQDTTYHSNTIYFHGTAGIRYQVEVTVFAEDDDGAEYRTKTVYVTA